MDGAHKTLFSASVFLKDNIYMAQNNYKNKTKLTDKNENHANGSDLFIQVLENLVLPNLYYRSRV